MLQQSLNSTNAGWDAGREKYYATLFAGLASRARRALSGRRADALDLAQETMERFLVQFGRGPLPAEPIARAWLSRTFDRLVITEWRKHDVRRRALADPALI
jgi:DNA-directed RNA polymerase specialized sigma24 family protein